MVFTGVKVGFIHTGYNALITAIASDSAEEKHRHIHCSAIAPSSMQVFIEQYIMGYPWTSGHSGHQIENLQMHINL